MGKQKADYLLRSDHIFTSTVENPFAGYVAVSGQNILAVGTDDGSDWIDEQTEVLELGDQLVTPGFIDVHTFFTGYAIFHIGIDMSGITSQEEFLQKIKEQVEKEKEPSTVFGHGWNPNGFETEGLEEKLNEAYSDRAVIVFAADRSTCMMNRKAEEAYGFNPKECYPEAYHKIMPEYLNDRDFIEPEFKDYMKLMNSRGVTTVKEMGFDNFYGFTDILAELEQKAELSLRISFMSQPVGKKMDLAYGKEMKKKYHSDFLRFSGYNQMTDGLIVSEEADLMEPYEGKDYCCQKNIDYALLEEDVLTADREGFRFTLHSEGDGSFHKILQIYDKCEKENGRLKNRHGITDLELTGAVDEEKMAQLGVFGEIYTQVYKLDSCENWKQDYDEKLGSRRSRYMNYRSMADHGVILSGATDLPMLIPDIPEAIYYGCGTYAADGKEPVQPENGLTIPEMLKTWTIGSQYAMEQERILGTLESGKQADIVVFDRNLLKTDIEEIRKAHVLRTICAGQDVYKEMENR